MTHMTHKIGNIYRLMSSEFDCFNDLFILAQTNGSMVSPITLTGHGKGNRWNHPVHVASVKKLSPSEWNMVTDNIAAFKFVGTLNADVPLS